MCGIAGIIGIPYPSRLKSMLQSTVHRGPDDRGEYSDSYLSVGMNRLAIQDLSPAGHQPMFSDDGRYLIVYNGEVYNFPELREGLVAKGHSFHSQSDTEVILKMYLEHGEDCLGYLEGMFAFIIYDTVTHRLFGARDRLGIKPFYYQMKDGVLVFASEIKAMLASGLVDFRLSDEAVRQYFTFGNIQQPLTILEDVKALSPGFYFVLEKSGAMNIRPYWELRADKAGYDIQKEEAQEAVYQLMDESVRTRLISDRPMGIFLSGGLDSAIILHHTAKHSRNVTTFTVGFAENPYARDERKDAEEVARHFGTSHESIFVDAHEVSEEFDDFVFALDQPSIDGLNTYIVSKYAVKKMTVALSGLGGDELFAGYNRHSLLYWKYISNQGSKDWFASLLKGSNPLFMGLWNTKQGDFLLKVKSSLTAKNIPFNYVASRTTTPPSEVNAILKNTGFYQPDEYANLFKAYNGAPGWDVLQTISNLEIFTFMSSQLLRDMDAVSMTHSLEVRFPFLDHRLVEYVFSLSSDSKLVQPNKKPRGEGTKSYQEDGSKKILQDIYKSLLPEGFMQRKKQGFRLPLQMWVEDFLLSRYQEKLTEFGMAYPEYRMELCKDKWKALIFVSWVLSAKKIAAQATMVEYA